MSSQITTEILAAHADQLSRGGKVKLGALLSASPGESDEVASLVDVATRLHDALRPAVVPLQFRADLHNGLNMAAEHKASQRILIEQHDPAWGWIIGAAALGSAAGLIAIRR